MGYRRNKMKSFKVIAGICAISLLLTGCGKAKLENGKELVLEMKGIKITADDFYSTLKNKYGIETLVNEMDIQLLNKKYPTTSNMKKQIETQILSIKEQTGSNFADAIKYYYGVNTEKELYDFIEMNMKKKTAEEDYAKSIITDDDIKKYYDEKSIGDIKASHILIKPSVKDSMTDEEKKTEEDKALQKAKDIIKELDSGAVFADLAKKYSQDEGSATKGGDVGFFNRGDMQQEFEDASVSLEVGKYTKEPVKTTYGYHIILKTEQKDKPKLDKTLKSSIKDTLVKDKVTNTTNIEAYTMEALRKEYKLKIYDAQMKVYYDDYVSKQKAQ
jgi:foldase protein PrsA